MRCATGLFRSAAALPLAVMLMLGWSAEAAPGHGGGFKAPRPAGAAPTAPPTTSAGGGAALQNAEQAATLSALGSIAPLERDSYTAELTGSPPLDPYLPILAPAGVPQTQSPPEPPRVRLLGALRRPLALKQPVQPLLTLRPARPSLVRIGASSAAFVARASPVRTAGDSVAFANPHPGAACGRFAWRDGPVVYALTTC